MKRVLQEGALVAVIGAALAFAADRVSPYHFDLTEDYYAGKAKRSSLTGTNVIAGAGATTNSPWALQVAKFQAEGLQLADSNRVMQLYNDPRRQVGWVIFIDSRHDEEYRAGHIPGAYLFDRLHKENYIADILQPWQIAEQLVFYCNGGDCDDSEHTAILLRDSLPQMPKTNVFVYGGGMHEWASNSLPIELGARNSGVLTNPTQTATSPRSGATHP